MADDRARRAKGRFLLGRAIWFASAVLERAAGLSARALGAIAELERQVVGVDGGRLKLEWGMLRRRSGERVDDLLWWDGERLLGFLGLYGFGSSAELAGMVAPDRRRRGIGSALLDAAVPLCRERGCRDALRRACEQLRAAGARRIRLEVAVENDRE